MYARLFTANVQPGKFDGFSDSFGELILPGISQEPGFKGIYVLGNSAENKIVALVLWETEAAALASVDGYMRQRLPRMASVLAGQPVAETLQVMLRA